MSTTDNDKATASWSFGSYEVEGLINSGGMGNVFRARQPKLERVVALKMIHAESQTDPEDLTRFEREARAAALVQHPNIVQVFDAGQIHGQSFFAMEYVEGPDLEHVTEGGPLDPREAARHVAAVANAVHHLHGQGILHRDLKPSNILIAPDGTPKVTDFGIARVVGTGTGKTTDAGVALGTPSYMAPEQAAADRGDVGVWTDIHGLGAVLYRLLTGRAPFEAETAMDTMLEAIHKPPPPPRTINPAVPVALEAICFKCLEKRPDRRYASADAVQRDLERFLAGEMAEALRQTAWTHLRRWIARETNLAVHIGALGLVTLAKLVTGLLEPSDSPTDIVVAGVLVGWICCCLLVHRLAHSHIGRSAPARVGPAGLPPAHGSLAWGALDVLFLTGVLLVVNGTRSPALMGYPLLVMASGLWLRVRPVILTTLLALGGFLMLVTDSFVWHTQRRLAFDGYIIVAVLIVAAGMLTVRQVRQTRALGGL